jgi:hypothetical protein
MRLTELALLARQARERGDTDTYEELVERIEARVSLRRAYHLARFHEEAQTCNERLDRLERAAIAEAIVNAQYAKTGWEAVELERAIGLVGGRW